MKHPAALALCVLLPLAACDEDRRTTPVAVATTAAPLRGSRDLPAARAAAAPLAATAPSHRAASCDTVGARTAPAPTAPLTAKPSRLVPAPGKPPPALARWDGVTTAIHHDAKTNLSFAIPSAGYRLEAEHFDASLPVNVTKAIFTLFAAAGPAVTLDVWDVPAGTTLLSFFDAHLAFMVAGTTKVIAKTTASVVLDEPRSPQSYARRAAIFAAPGRILRVTCHDTTEHGAVSAFEHVMKTLPRGATP